MSFKGSVRDICKKIGIGRLLLLGLAGAVLVLCSLDFGSILSGTGDNQTGQGSEADSSGQSGGTNSEGTSSGNSSGSIGAGSAGDGGSGTSSNAADGSGAISSASLGNSALTDVYEAATEEALSMQELEARLEVRLESLISQIEGAGEVEVMIVLASGVGKEILKDESTSKDEVTETDSAGGSRQSVSFDKSEDTVMDSAGGSSGQTPYVLKNLAPEVTGVAVVAEGGGDAGVAAKITELVAALFGIDVTQISVAGMK